MSSVVAIEDRVRTATTDTFVPGVAVPVLPAFVLALGLAFILFFVPAFILAFVLAFVFVFALAAFAVAALATVVLVDMAAIELVAGAALPLLLAPSPASIVAEVDIVTCQSIAGAYLRSEVGKHTSDAFEKRRVGGGLPGLAYRRGEGGACCVCCLWERGVAVMRRPNSRRRLPTPLK